MGALSLSGRSRAISHYSLGREDDTSPEPEPEGIIVITTLSHSEMKNFRDHATAKASPPEKPILINKDEMMRLPAAMNVFERIN